MVTADPIVAPRRLDIFGTRLQGRVVVVSPHFDDAVMSLGATIAQLAHAGVEIEVLTVFGGDTASKAPADAWDRKSGFSSEGSAANGRRGEDRKACALLGARPRWLKFGAEAYERHGSEDEIWTAVAAATENADLVLLPGRPLAHRDHAELSRLLLRRGLSCRRIALYVEQPYSFYRRETVLESIPVPALSSVLSDPLNWERLGVNRPYRRMKLQAVRAYRSQLRQLGLGWLGRQRMLWYEASQGGEAIAWVPAPNQISSMTGQQG
jgi:LmbE family N-acetylglucosaminyl deacetylase